MISLACRRVFSSCRRVFSPCRRVFSFGNNEPNSIRKAYILVTSLHGFERIPNNRRFGPVWPMEFGVIVSFNFENAHTGAYLRLIDHSCTTSSRHFALGIGRAAKPVRYFRTEALHFLDNGGVPPVFGARSEPLEEPDGEAGTPKRN